VFRTRRYVLARAGLSVGIPSRCWSRAVARPGGARPSGTGPPGTGRGRGRWPRAAGQTRRGLLGLTLHVP